MLQMEQELLALAWGCLLALVHIFAAGQARTRQYGTRWNVGARDEALAPPAPLVGRLTRAQANFFETFPIMIAAVLIVVLADRTSELTALGAWIWLAARLIYLPLYALGTPVVRTFCFLVSMIGLAMVLFPALRF